MRHNFYANCRNNITPKVTRNRLKQSRQPPFNTNKTKMAINKFILPLEDMIRIVLDKYAENPILIEEIREKIEMYRINYSIADNISSTKSKKKLTKDLRDYLSKLYKKEN